MLIYYCVSDEVMDSAPMNVESLTTANLHPEIKHELDNSYKNESGVYSNESNNSAENNVAESSWELFAGECCDPSHFDPPLHSTDTKGPMMLCNISSIEGDAKPGV